MGVGRAHNVADNRSSHYIAFVRIIYEHFAFLGFTRLHGNGSNSGPCFGHAIGPIQPLVICDVAIQPLQNLVIHFESCQRFKSPYGIFIDRYFGLPTIFIIGLLLPNPVIGFLVLCSDILLKFPNNTPNYLFVNNICLPQALGNKPTQAVGGLDHYDQFIQHR